MTNHSLVVALMSVAIGCSPTSKGEARGGVDASTGAGGALGSGGVVGGGGAVGSGGVGTGGAAGATEGTVYTFDLTGFGTTQSPGGLVIANKTLAFPLALGPTEQFLSPTNPGELVVAYTRVGCWVDAEGWFRTDAANVLQVRQVQPVALTEVTIDQFAGASVTVTPQQLAEATCLSLKSQDGQWTAFLQPQTITMLSPDSVRAQFVIDRASVASAAIFLPTYTNVSRIAYRVAPQ